MSNILFSVIIPVYNREELITSTIESILNQKYKNFEIIVIDDGSTDRSLLEIQKYSGLKNFRFKSIKNSGGPAKPRNIGISMAKGDYICFLDSDDTWEPDKLSRDFQVITENFHPDVVYGKANVYYNDNYLKSIGTKIVVPFKDIVNGAQIPLSSTSVKRAEIKKNKVRFCEDKHLKAVEDHLFWIELAEKNCHFEFTNYSLTNYHLHETQISSDPVSQCTRLNYLYKKLLKKKDIKNEHKALIIRAKQRNYFTLFKSAILKITRFFYL